MSWLLDRLRDVGGDGQVAALLARDPAAHVCLDDSRAVSWLLEKLREVGADEQVTASAERAAVTSPSASRTPWAGCWTACGRWGRTGRSPRCWLVTRPLTSASMTRLTPWAGLLDSLRKVGADGQVAALLARDPAAHVPLDDPDAVSWLLDSLRERGRRMGRSLRCWLVTRPLTSASMTQVP